MQDNIKLKPLIFKSENNKIIAVTENKKVDGEANKKCLQMINYQLYDECDNLINFKQNLKQPSNFIFEVGLFEYHKDGK